LLKTFDTVEKAWLAESARLSDIQNVNYYVTSVFSTCFRDPIRVHRIENRIPRIRENYQRVSRIRENRIGTGPYWVPNNFLKSKLRNVTVYVIKAVKLLLIVALHGILEMIMMNSEVTVCTALIWCESNRFWTFMKQQFNSAKTFRGCPDLM